MAAARPHPLAAYAYIAYRVAENIVNHSGLDDSFLDVLFLKIHVLGRAKASHHDAHHKVGSRSASSLQGASGPPKAHHCNINHKWSDLLRTPKLSCYPAYIPGLGSTGLEVSAAQ